MKLIDMLYGALGFTGSPRIDGSVPSNTMTPPDSQNGSHSLESLSAQIDTLRTDYATLRAEHTITRSELSDAREQLGYSRSTIESLQRTTGNQDRALAEIGSAMAVTQSQLEQALQDKQYQAIQIRDLQQQLIVLKTQLEAANEQLAINNGQRQGLQLAFDEVSRENVKLKTQLSVLENRRIEADNAE